MPYVDLLSISAVELLNPSSIKFLSLSSILLSSSPLKTVMIPIVHWIEHYHYYRQNDVPNKISCDLKGENIQRSVST